MKVFNKESGEQLEREPIDVRELVSTGEYTVQDPDKPGERVETSGEVLARSERARVENWHRAGYQQQADATAVADAEKMKEVNPAMRARKQADDARKHADEVTRVANNGGLGVAVAPTAAAVAKLKADAADAEKRAAKLEADAAKAEKQQEADNAELKSRREKEQSATDKFEKSTSRGKGGDDKGGKQGSEENEDEDDLESLSKSDLQERLDKKGISYPASANKSALIDLLSEK